MLSWFEFDKVNIDGKVFRCHYKVTVIILIVFGLITTAGQFMGDPIECDVNVKISQRVIDTFCWIHSTFTVYIPNSTESEYPGRHPSLQPRSKGDKIIHHKYYQWVCFMFFFQAIMFYVPRFLWQTWESDKVKYLVQDLNKPVIGEESKHCLELVVDYFTANMHTHNFYAITFFLCEILNFVNVVAQIYFIDFFLGGQFTTYGLDVFGITEIEPQYRSDPMSKVFPKIAKCTFHKLGPSGTSEAIDGLCLLRMNMLNRYIYIFLWLWFIILATVTGLALVYRSAVIFTRFRLYLLRSHAPCASHQDLRCVSRKCWFGDLFLLLQLSKNIDPVFFKELISDLAHSL